MKKHFLILLTLSLLLAGCSSSNEASVSDSEPAEADKSIADDSYAANTEVLEPQSSEYSDDYVSFEYDNNLFEVETSDDKLTISITCPSMPNEPDGSHNTMLGITTQPNQDASDITEGDVRLFLESLSKKVCQNVFALNDDESIITDSSKYSDCCAEYMMEISDGSICYAKCINYNSYISAVALRLCEYSEDYNDAFKDIYDSVKSELGNYDFNLQSEKENSASDGSANEVPQAFDEETSVTSETTGQRNALRKAKQYLDYSAFSYSGLIDQLEYEKFSLEDATYAADHCGADWNKQALDKAKSYLDYTAFSYSGLIEQLKYEKYTDEQATYAVDNCGADWNEQAVEKAKSYLEFSSFSKDGLIEQLEYEGFTHEQAVYGVEQNGY